MILLGHADEGFGLGSLSHFVFVRIVLIRNFDKVGGKDSVKFVNMLANVVGTLVHSICQKVGILGE